jgi:hypothetical protein
MGKKEKFRSGIRDGKNLDTGSGIRDEHPRPQHWEKDKKNVFLKARKKFILEGFPKQGFENRRAY